MFSRYRTSKFTQEETTYKCEDCTYGTDKKSNFARHLTSSRHRHLETDAGLCTAATDQPVFRVQPQVQDDELADQHEHVQADQLYDDMSEVDEPTFPEDVYESDIDEEDFRDEYHTATHHAHVDMVESDSEWFPFMSKLHFLLSILYSSKTHRVSDEVMTFFLFILKECGTQNIPPLAKIKSYLQEKFEMGEMIQRHEDAQGNISWAIKPSAMLRLHLANPDTANRISRYPTVETSSESVHQASGNKWKSMEFHWAMNKEGQQFIKGAFVSFSVRGQTVYGKIMQFLENLLEDRMYVKVSVYLDKTHRVLTDEYVENNCLVKMDKYRTVSLDDCQTFDVSNIRSFKEILNGELSYVSNEEIEEILQSSTLWRGLPVVSVPINLFMDDLSANQSRRWSPLHAVQGQISGLPLEQKNKGKSVMFLGLSDKMSMLDLMSPICSDIKQCKQFGIETYDAALKQKVIMITDISLIVTDYQMMSLACNHLGPSANKFCPKCFADDSDPFKKWDMRSKEATSRTMERIRLHVDRTTMQRQTGVKEYDNCLWDYLDTHKDTPIGILHFLYLGLAKQLIKFSLDSLTEHQKNLLKLHLDSIDQSSFSYRIQISFFQYIDSRQGKDYKHYLQIAVLNMEYAGLPKKYLCVLEKLAMISKHMIKKENTIKIVQELDEYLNILKQNIPQLGRKRKTHLCVHLADDIERHGHPLQYAEDGFEKNHKSVRSSIAHQNGHARSRDTASQFVNNELMGHVISGGFMPDSQNWKCAAEKIKLFGKNKKILNFLGMPSSQYEENLSGLKKMVRKPTANGDDLMNHYEVQILQAIINCGGQPGLLGSSNLKIVQFKSCVTKQGDTAKVDSFVLYHVDEDDTDKIGQIEKFVELSWKGNNHQMVILKKAKLVPTQTTFQHLTTEPLLEITPVSRVLQSVHVIHDCKGGKCTIKEGSVSSRVEQEQQNVKCKFIKHSNVHNIFIINKCRISHSVDKFVI
ncbi:unnamed protein product [Mytilus edulis]|uniref:C2H2-type domain-containing protein n=1 Tax=Mytilus edulis TaxID=6550 RepID=A0A8S3QF13_MYTED|nr:unnamed protein product [Mytilus edulis]